MAYASAHTLIKGPGIMLPVPVTSTANEVFEKTAASKINKLIKLSFINITPVKIHIFTKTEQITPSVNAQFSYLLFLKYWLTLHIDDAAPKKLVSKIVVRSCNAAIPIYPQI
jgi:exosortase/archaeosortase